MMITRLTSRHRSTVRNPIANHYGPASTGFPSVRSKMLNPDEVRGETFFDSQKFSYSQYVVPPDQQQANTNVNTS